MIRTVRLTTLLASVAALVSIFFWGFGHDDLDLASRALRNRDPDMALRLTTRMLTFSTLGDQPKEKLAHAHALRAMASHQRGQFEYARKELDTAIGLKPDDPGLLYLRGEWLLDAGDCARAAKDYDHGLEVTPDLSLQARIADHLARAARAHFCVNDHTGASRLLEKAFSMDGSNAEAFFTKSFMLEKAGDQNGALRAMERAWKLRASNQRDSFFFLTPKGDVWLHRLVVLLVANGIDPFTSIESHDLAK